MVSCIVNLYGRLILQVSLLRPEDWDAASKLHIRAPKVRVDYNLLGLYKISRIAFFVGASHIKASACIQSAPPRNQPKLDKLVAHPHTTGGHNAVHKR